MFGMTHTLLLSQWALEEKAKSEGREVTPEEWKAMFEDVFERSVEAGVRLDMARVEAGNAARASLMTEHAFPPMLVALVATAFALAIGATLLGWF